jgi:AcrR family transcriptional regulator
MSDGPVESSRSDPAGRRREILDAAARIFRDKGYAATSIQDVAQAVDILKGSLYYYIDSKDDLLFEVIQEVHQDGLANLAEAKKVSGSALEKIHSFVVRHASFNAGNLAQMTVFFQDFKSLSDERHKLIVEERDLYDEYLRGVIAAGKDEGSVRSSVDAKLAAFWILGGMNWMYQWYRADGPQSLDEITEAFAELAVNSVRDPDWQPDG